MHRYRKRPKIPPLFEPLQNCSYTELGHHLFLEQLNLANVYLNKDEKSLAMLTILFDWIQSKTQKSIKNEENNSKIQKNKKKKKKEQKDQISNENNHSNFSLYTYEPPILKTEETEIDKSERQLKLFKWLVECFLNSIQLPFKRQPECPIDYSNILPEFADVNSLYMYAQMPTDDLISIYQAYPYDFFKVCSQMTPEFANDFIIACLFNEKVPIHLGSRLISFFPLTKIQIDYTVVYERRCHTFNNMCSLFEGLLCNCNNQLKAAEVLAGGYEDTALNDDCLVLINNSIRSYTYFVDKDLPKTIELFPSASTIDFLVKTAIMPLCELRKLLKVAKPTEYVTRLSNQISLIEFLKIGDNWKKLDKWSIPILLAAAHKRDRISSEILFEIPRDSLFFTYPASNWKIDFDFIQSFVAIQSMLLDYQLNPYPSYLNYDIFSLLFLSKKRRMISKRPKKAQLTKNQANASQHSNQNKQILNGNKRIPIKPTAHSQIHQRQMKEAIHSNSNNQHITKETIHNNSNHQQKIKETTHSNSNNQHTAKEVNNIGSNRPNVQSNHHLITEKNQTNSNIHNNQTNHVDSNVHSEMNSIKNNVNGDQIKNETVLSNSNIGDNDDYFFDVETALNIVTFIQKNGKPPQDLIPYLSNAEKKLKTCLLLFESPTLKDSLLTTNEYFMKSLNSIDTINKMIGIYGTAPTYVKSKLFTLKMVKKLGLKPTHSIKSIPFKGRLHSNQKISEKAENAVHLILSEFPRAIQNQILLDLVSSERKLSILVKLIDNDDNLNPIFKTFVKLLKMPIKRYPTNLNFNSARSISDYNKLLTGIISCHLYNTHLDQFSRLLYNLTTIKSQSFYKFQNVRTQIQLHVLMNSLDSWSSLKMKMRGTGIDPLEFLINRNRPDLCTPSFYEKVISEEPMIFIPFARNKNISDSKLASFITKHNFHRVKKFLSFSKEKKEENVNDILENLNNIDNQDKKMEILEDLLYQHEDISNYFYEILKIIKEFPVDWSVTFIETFISLLDANNPAVIPLTKRLNDIKPLATDIVELSEIERIQSRWDTLIKLASNTDDVISRPQHFYRLCAFHLQNHLIGRDIITYIKYFCFILVSVRNYRLFDNQASETAWIKNFLTEGVSSIKAEDIANMIIDIGLNHSYECGKLIADECKDIDLSEYVKNAIYTSINLLSYVKDPTSLLNTVLSEQKVNCAADEVFLLKFLSKISSIASEIPLFKVLNEFAHNAVCYRYKIAYNGQSLQKLFDIAMKIDSLKLIDYFNQLEIQLTPSVKNKIDRNLSIFGFVPNIDRKIDKKLMFTSSKMNFSLDSNFSNTNELNHPTLFSIESNADNSISVYRLSLQKRDIKVIYRPDFSFFEIQKKSKELRIGDNYQQIFVNNMNEFHGNEENGQKETIKFMNFQNMKNTINKYLGATRIFELFESLSSTNLHTLLKFANVKGLIYMIYQICVYVQNHTELNKIFIFPKSALKEYQENEKQQKLQEFIATLKSVLIKAIEFTSDVDSLELLPSNVIISGNVNQLKDISTLLEYQSEIGIENNLVVLKANEKINLIAKLFYDMEFERGFNLVNILKLDLNLVLTKTVKMVRDENDITKLGKFLFNIVPRLDMDTANELIKTISSNLAKNDANKPILNLLVSGIDDSRNVYQMLMNFRFIERATYVAIQEGLPDEIENSLKEAKIDGNEQIVRTCNRWIGQNDMKKDANIQNDVIDS